MFGVELQLPAVVQLMFQGGEHRFGTTFVVAPVRTGVERAGRAEVTTVGFVHREAVVAGTVTVHVLILRAHGQHRVIGDVPFQYPVRHLLVLGLAVNMALAVGVRRNKTSANMAAFGQRAGHVQLGAIVIPRAGLEGECALRLECRLLANQVHSRTGVAGA
ncbi:hypothetical protein D3C73_656550 [compost metagenome]